MHVYACSLGLRRITDITSRFIPRSIYSFLLSTEAFFIFFPCLSSVCRMRAWKMSLKVFFSGCLVKQQQTIVRVTEILFILCSKAKLFNVSCMFVRVFFIVVSFIVDDFWRHKKEANVPVLLRFFSLTMMMGHVVRCVMKCVGLPSGL